jgi:hypothetical protein
MVKVAAGVLVIAVGCSTPPPVAAPGPHPAPQPVVVAPVVAPSPPPLAIGAHLVDALPPLHDKHGHQARHQPATATASHVISVKREGDQARVRVHRIDDAVDRNWLATFVDAGGKHLADCKIVAWDADQIECVTALPLAKMTADVMLEPPTRESQIKAVLLAQAQGDELLVTFAAGTANDVASDWNAELVDDNGAAVPQGGCRIVSVSETTTMCRTPAKVDQLYGVRATRP